MYQSGSFLVCFVAKYPWHSKFSTILPLVMGKVPDQFAAILCFSQFITGFYGSDNGSVSTMAELANGVIMASGAVPGHGPQLKHSDTEPNNVRRRFSAQ
jgi:hypothetical protein